MDNKKTYLILERSESNLRKIDDQQDIILEGIFAEFGKENRNGRIYDKDEYLKHLSYLIEDVKNQRCLGELDHPDRFEISLSNVSHQVCELRYDPNDNCVHGKIKLLSTPKGLIAKTLLEAGVPLSISSRAAGTVNENKHVQLEQIYTYDIVAKPGFAAAQLTQVNESAKPLINNLISQLNESYNNVQKSDIKANLGILNENVTLIDMTKQYPQMKLRDEAVEIINGENNTEDLHSELQQPTEVNIINDEALNKWTEQQNEYISNLEKRIQELENKGNEILKIKQYLDKLKDILQNTLDWNSEIATNVNSLIDYVEQMGDASNKHLNVTNDLRDELEDKSSEIEVIKECLNRFVSNKLKLNESGSNQFYLEELKKSSRFSSYTDKELVDMVDMTKIESAQEQDKNQIIDQVALGLQTMYNVKNYEDAFIMANKLYKILNKKINESMLIKEQEEKNNLKDLLADVESNFSDKDMNRLMSNPLLKRIIDVGDYVLVGQKDKNFDAINKEVEQNYELVDEYKGIVFGAKLEVYLKLLNNYVAYVFKYSDDEDIVYAINANENLNEAKNEFSFSIKKGSDLGDYISKAAIGNKVNRMKTVEEYTKWLESIIKTKFGVNPKQLMKNNQITVKEVLTTPGKVGDFISNWKEYRIKLNGGHENTGALKTPLFVVCQPKETSLNEASLNEELNSYIMQKLLNSPIAKVFLTRYNEKNANLRRLSGFNVKHDISMPVIEWDKVKDDDFVVISDPAIASRLPYKNNLNFWAMNGYIFAITYKNKPMLLAKNYISTSNSAKPHRRMNYSTIDRNTGEVLYRPVRQYTKVMDPDSVPIKNLVDDATEVYSYVGDIESKEKAYDEKKRERREQKSGALAFKSNDQVKQENMDRYKKILRIKKYTDGTLDKKVDEYYKYLLSKAYPESLTNWRNDSKTMREMTNAQDLINRLLPVYSKYVDVVNDLKDGGEDDFRVKYAMKDLEKVLKDIDDFKATLDVFNESEINNYDDENDIEKFDISDEIDLDNLSIGDNMNIKFNNGNSYTLEIIDMGPNGEVIGSLKPFGFVNKFNFDKENKQLIDNGMNISDAELEKIVANGYSPKYDQEEEIYRLK